MTLIDEVERRYTSSRVSEIVVCNFSGSKIFRPGGRVVSSIDAEILFESAVGAFSLSISLWMISGREAKSSFQSKKNSFTQK